MKFVELRYTIRGIEPLLLASPASMLYKKTGPSRTKADPSPEEQAELSAYRLESGQLCGPAQGIRSGIVDSSTTFRVPKQRKTLQANIMHMRINPVELLPITDHSGKPVMDYVVDSRRGVNKTTKGGITVIRPMIPEWQASFSVMLDEDSVPVTNLYKAIEDCLIVAGVMYGWGAFRPEKGGWFGTYEVIDSD